MVGRIAMRKTDFGNFQRNFIRQGSFTIDRLRERSRYPGIDIVVQFDATLCNKDRQFPNANRREPQLIFFVVDGLGHFLTQSVRGGGIPNPNVSVEQQSHFLSTSQSSESQTGETISPLIRAVPTIAPNRFPLRPEIEGGATSATGSPKRVTSIGFRVRRTRSSTSRQVALNLEIAISSIQPSDAQDSMYYGLRL